MISIKARNRKLVGVMPVVMLGLSFEEVICIHFTVKDYDFCNQPICKMVEHELDIYVLLVIAFISSRTEALLLLG